MKIGILGYGTVGQGLVDVIDNNKEKRNGVVLNDRDYAISFCRCVMPRRGITLYQIALRYCDGVLPVRALKKRTKCCG